MIINNNMMAQNTHRQLSLNSAAGQKSIEKLSSGSRINRAGDDAAGLAISEKMRAQIRGLNQGARNAQDSISLIQTAEGALNETHDILQRMRELATQSASDTNVNIDRDEIQKEINQLTSEINRIGNTTEFNTMKLLDGGSGQTGQIRYSVATAGMAEIDATGDMSEVTTISNSVKASSAAVDAVNVAQGSTLGAAAVGDLAGPATTVASVKEGTGEVSNFSVDNESYKAVNNGSVADSFHVIQGSTLAGTGDIEKTHLTTGASNEGELDGFKVQTESVLGGTGAMQKSTLVEGAVAATATYAVEITAQFTAGDTIKIGDTTLTATTEAGAPGTSFQIGADIATTRDNILTALEDVPGGAAYTVDGVTYNMSAQDLDYDSDGYTDANLIVFTNAAGDGADVANKAVFENIDNDVVQVGASQGVYSFEVATNYEVGQEIEINGYKFTATATASTETTFQIGTDVSDTASNLKDAMDLAKADGATEFANYNISLGVAGIYSDTITLTEAVASGNDLAVADVADLTTTAVNAVYAYEIKSNFTAGDTFKIGQETYTAKGSDHNGAVDHAAGVFEIGDTIEDTRDNIQAMLTAISVAGGGAGDTNTENYVVSTIDPAWNGNADATLLVFTAKVAQTDTNQAAMNASAVTNTLAKAGEYAFEVAANFGVGEKISINGYEFTSMADNAPAVSLSSAAGAPGTRSIATYDVTNHGTYASGDTIEIYGETFTAVTGAADAAAGQFSIDTDAAATRTSLVAALQANSNITDVFTVAAAGGNTFTLTEDNALGENGGVATTSRANTLTHDPSTPAAAATATVDTYTIDSDFVAGQTITIDGEIFTAVDGDATAADGEFSTTGTVEDRAASLASAINANAALSAIYTAAATSGGDFTLTEVVTGAGGAASAGAATIESNTTTGFIVGATVNETADNLKTALDLAKADGATEFANFNISMAGAGIYSDTVKLTEVAATGTDLASGDVAVTARNSEQGVYSFEVTENFTVGDKIEIAGQEFTAVAADGANTATTFKVGDDAAATVNNLKAAIDLSTLVAGGGAGKYITELGNDKYGYSNKITLTENVADGNDIAGPNVEKVQAIQGQYEMLLQTNFKAGESIEIAGQTFTAKASGAVAANGEFNVGGNTDATASSLKDALDAKLAGEYTVDRTGSTLRFTEATGSGEAITKGTTSGVGEVTGQYEYTVSSNFSAGDKVTIAGTEFSAKASGADAANKEFNVGGNLKTTTENLVATINNAGSPTSTRFTASMVTDNSDPLAPVYSIKMVEKGGQATGVDLGNVSMDLVQEEKGVYTVDVENNFAAGDRVTIDNVTLVAGDDFAVGLSASATAENLMGAINDNAVLSDRFTATQDGNKIALTENDTKATGADLTDPVVRGDATAGEYKFQMSALGEGSVVAVDGQNLTLASGGTEASAASALKTAIEQDSTLNARYTVSVTASEVTLTQKEGQESATAPKLSYTTQAGSGYRSQMQIGANTGQSMSLDVKDMRASALSVSSNNGAAGQTVEVEGKQFAVNWTSNVSVTNGTDNVSVEYALDVSSHDNATAAIRVINDAIESVSAQRSQLGAFQNRLEHTIKNLGTSAENLQAAESRVRDLDMAKEMMNFTKNNILQQAATSMLAQANQAPQAVLQLLR